MIKTIEATIDEKGIVHLIEPIKIKSSRRALVTILEEKPSRVINEEALLSESVLAKDWDKQEEEEAWSYLQSDQ